MPPRAAGTVRAASSAAARPSVLAASRAIVRFERPTRTIPLRHPPSWQRVRSGQRVEPALAPDDWVRRRARLLLFQLYFRHADHELWRREQAGDVGENERRPNMTLEVVPCESQREGGAADRDLEGRCGQQVAHRLRQPAARRRGCRRIARRGGVARRNTLVARGLLPGSGARGARRRPGPLCDPDSWGAGRVLIRRPSRRSSGVR